MVGKNHNVMRPKRHLEAAYKSGLEAKFQQQTKDLGYNLPYEMDRIKYVIPASKHTYTPDFTVTENIYIETKGLWTGADRKKAILIKEQHPHIHILYVFYRDQKLSKKSSTTYLAWAQKNGLEACTFADKPTWISYIEKHI
jgi:hypothetical protein